MIEHVFKASLAWQPQNLPFTYKEYSRQFLARIEGKQDVIGSSAKEFLGSPYHHNPEDLLVISLSSCHMLTYLAVAANSKVQVLSYEDAPEGILSNETGVFKFKEMILRPTIVITKDSDLAKAESLHEKAHHNCFIANSVNFPVRIEPKMSQG